MICILKVIHYFSADVFKNFRKVCLKIYHLDPAKFLWSLKNSGVKLELLTNIDMLLIVEEGIRGGICHEIYQ